MDKRDDEWIQACVSRCSPPLYTEQCHSQYKTKGAGSYFLEFKYWGHRGVPQRDISRHCRQIVNSGQLPPTSWGHRKEQHTHTHKRVTKFSTACVCVSDVLLLRLTMDTVTSDCGSVVFYLSIHKCKSKENRGKFILIHMDI